MKDQETWDDRYPLLNLPYLRWGIFTTAVNITLGVDTRAAVIICTAAVTVTLPPAVDAPNKVYWIKNAFAGAVTIDASGADLIDGAANQTLADQFDVMAVISDGTTWHVLSSSDL